MRVVKISKKSNNKYNIELDNGNKIVLFEDVIVKYIILVNKEIDDSLYEEIMNDNNKALVYHQALKYLNIRMRSIKELEKYLLKKYDDNIIDEVIAKLKKEGYLNDELYVKAYLNDKLNLSNDGLYKIKNYLLKQDIDDSLINKYISNVDNSLINDKLNKLIIKQIKLNHKYSGKVLKQRILNYLINLGYDYDLIIENIDNYQFDNNNIKEEYQKLYNKYSSKLKGNKLEMKINESLYKKGYDISNMD